MGNGEPTRHRVKAFRQLGENIADSLGKGDRVIVHGTVTTETWTDKDTGEKRTGQKILADVVGPSLRWATVRITKSIRVTAEDTDSMPTENS
jgi:single-strand DNA-binding protein